MQDCYVSDSSADFQTSQNSPTMPIPCRCSWTEAARGAGMGSSLLHPHGFSQESSWVLRAPNLVGRSESELPGVLLTPH